MKRALAMCAATAALLDVSETHAAPPGGKGRDESNTSEPTVQHGKGSTEAVRHIPCDEQLQLSTEARISYENAVYPAVDDQVSPEGMSARLQLPNWKVTRANGCRPSREAQDGLSIGYTVLRFSRSAFLERSDVERSSAQHMNSPAVSIVDVGWFGRVCIHCTEQWGAGLEGRLGIAYNSGATVRYELNGTPTNVAIRPWGLGPAWGMSLFVSFKRFSLGGGMNGSVAAGVIATALSVSLTYSGFPDSEDSLSPKPESKN